MDNSGVCICGMGDFDKLIYGGEKMKPWFILLLLVIFLVGGCLFWTATGVISRPAFASNSGTLYAQIRRPDGMIVRGICSEYTYGGNGIVTLIVDDVLYYAHSSNVLLMEKEKEF